MGTLIPTEGSDEEHNGLFTAPGTQQGCVESINTAVISNFSHAKGCITQIKAPLLGEWLRPNPAYRVWSVSLWRSNSLTLSPHHLHREQSYSYWSGSSLHRHWRWEKQCRVQMTPDLPPERKQAEAPASTVSSYPTCNLDPGLTQAKVSQTEFPISTVCPIEQLPEEAWLAYHRNCQTWLKT